MGMHGINNQSQLNIDVLMTRHFDPGAFITIEDMIEKMKMDMKSMDSVLKDQMDGQKKLQAKGEWLTKAKNEIDVLAQKWANGGNEHWGKDDEKLALLNTTIENLKTMANDPNCPCPEAIQSQINKLEGFRHKKDELVLDPNEGFVLKKTGEHFELGDKDGAHVSKFDFDKMSNDISNEVSDCQSEASLNMIKVQSTVSKREQLIQMITNIIRKMDEMASSVIGNIK